MNDSSYAKFGKLRSYLWPIHRKELKKPIPMLLMAFLTAFIYNTLRTIKDPLIVTAANSGAEVIPFLKVWAMLPMAVLITSVFVKLSHRYSSQQVFYLIVSGFLAFFLLFTFALYPVGDALHAHATADWLESVLPKGFAGFTSMIRYWSFSLFYAMAEIWGTMCLTVLFWGFANEVSTIGEAARFYGILAIGCNCSSIPSGWASKFICHKVSFFIGTDPWHQSLILITLTIVTAGVLLMLLFRWFYQTVVSKLDLPTNHHNPKLDKLEAKPSIRASFKTLMKSKYLTSIAIVVLSYNLVINLVEVLWKDQVKVLYPDPNDYTAYMSNVGVIMGIIATLMGLLVSGNMIRKFGWTATALLTPLILLITSIGFFGLYLSSSEALTAMFGVAPLTMIVFFGAAQNCFSRAAKYTVFDETKEMCFIPLSRQNRIKGKAAIDGVGSRIGKSGGSLIYQTMFIIFGRLAASAPYVAGLLSFILVGWIATVRRLGRQFKEATQEPNPEQEVGERQAV